MANLIISNCCDAACAYCFASAYMKSSRKPDDKNFMPLEEFEQALDYLDRSGIAEARLLGGEPTLHPLFGEFVRLARLRGKRVVVFSHGAMPQSALQSLLPLKPEYCNVIINMSAVIKPDAIAVRKNALSALGQRAMPGYTIQTQDFDLQDVVQTALDSGMRKVIRLGLALPGPGKSNRFVHQKQYRNVGRRIVEQADRFAEKGFNFSLDCGFVRCMFSEEEIHHLEQCKAELAWHCSPILDICSGNKVLHCFSLSDRFVLPLTAQSSAAEFHTVFESLTHGFRNAGIFRGCATCEYKIRQICSGGCLALTIRRFQPANFQVTLPAE